MSAISSILGYLKGRLCLTLMYENFSGVAALLNPPVVHHAPSWDLSLVLKAPSRPLFEPMATCSLCLLMLKMVFLVGITSARQFSEVAALSVAKDL